ncbi:DNA-binding transcription factor [Lithospermum erythrorhizon]|uniref:DNA-binding transcription factor n=1 Tax=Lithospermum erythrorhizon TaxID=34254 RepID=A0AAV3RQN1_LITER
MDVIIGDDVQNLITSLEVNGGGMGGGTTSGGGNKGFMLFGVRLMEEGSFRKSVSMNNLAQFGQLQENNNHDIIEAGYESDDIVHPSGKSRERKRGVPWTEEEHKLFLLGLQKVGKGDWRGISRNFVKTRTPTQVASHAQKYFLRRNNHNRRRRRSSLFDITTETVPNASIVDHQEKLHKPPMQHQKLIISQNIQSYSTSSTLELSHLTPMVLLHNSSNENINAMEGLTLGGPISQIGSPSRLIPPLPNIPAPPSTKLAKLNLNNTINDNLSLKLSNPTPTSSSSSSSSSGQQSSPTNHVSTFQDLPNSFNGGSGDSIISVA